MAGSVVLASSGEAAGVGDRHAQVFVGIDRRIVDADFVVEVRASGASAFANVADDVTAMHGLPGGHGKSGKMAVTRADAVAVIDFVGAAVATENVGKSDDSVGRGHDRMPE